MYEAQRFGVQRVPGHDVESLLHKHFVLAEHRAFHNVIAAIALIAEQRVPDVFHVYANLVGAAGFEIALYEAHKIQSFQHFVMRDGPFAMIAFRENGKHLPVFAVAAHMPAHSTLVGFGFAPNHCVISALYGVVKKLFGQV